MLLILLTSAIRLLRRIRDPMEPLMYTLRIRHTQRLLSRQTPASLLQVRGLSASMLMPHRGRLALLVARRYQALIPPRQRFQILGPAMGSGGLSIRRLRRLMALPIRGP